MKFGCKVEDLRESFFIMKGGGLVFQDVSGQLVGKVGMLIGEFLAFVRGSGKALN